jgi:outer membrane protein OmpA-like peptidoglycan-associated protein
MRALAPWAKDLFVHRSGPGSADQSACAIGDAGDDRGANLCVTFAPNSAVLASRSARSLDNFARFVKQTQAPRRFMIVAFTNDVGDRNQNVRLSWSRAEVIVTYLISKGVPPPRLSARGMGPTEFLPGRPHNDPANERVEARLPN